MCIFLFTVAVTVNYASEFRELFEATYTREKSYSCNYSLLCLLIENMKTYVYDLNDSEYHPNLKCLSLLYERNFILI